LRFRTGADEREKRSKKRRVDGKKKTSKPEGG